MTKTKDQKWEERFRKKFGKYTFCECDDIGIMVHGGDEPKKELLKFISKEISKAKKKIGEDILEFIELLDRYECRGKISPQKEREQTFGLIKGAVDNYLKK